MEFAAAVLEELRSRFTKGQLKDMFLLSFFDPYVAGEVPANLFGGTLQTNYLGELHAHVADRVFAMYQAEHCSPVRDMRGVVVGDDAPASQRGEGGELEGPSTLDAEIRLSQEHVFDSPGSKRSRRALEELKGSYGARRLKRLGGVDEDMGEASPDSRSAMDREMERYLAKEARFQNLRWTKLGERPADWWWHHQGDFPMLYKVACRMMTVYATSVRSE